jgi:hypothetical protein
MAAAMLCPPAGAGTQSEMPLMDHKVIDHEHAAGAVSHVLHSHDHGHEHGAQHDHGLTSQDKCNLCSAFCSLTPLLSSIAGIPDPGELVSAPFPDLPAPAPIFLSDGQERPPRSI